MSGARIDREDRMKKLLLGTTALIAAGAFVGTVQADEMMAEPVSVGVGGYYRVAVVSASGDAIDDERAHGIDQNIEINLSGETALDNGMTAGVNIWLDAMRGVDDDISETRAYFGGAFGTFTIGGFESAAQLGTIWAPGGNGNFGIKSPFFGGKRPSWQSAVAGDSEDSFKIHYASPAFNGISVSVSYEPDDVSGSYAGNADNDEGQISEVQSISVGFTQEVMGGSVSAGFGIENGTNEGCMTNCEATSIRGGLVISIDQISIGGAMLEDDNMGAESSSSDFGIGWSQGPLGLGIQYGSVDGAFEVTAFNAAYALGPGIEVNSQVAMGSEAGDDGDGWVELLIGTTINF
jgi:outer membrane protein OmpU